MLSLQMMGIHEQLSHFNAERRLLLRQHETLKAEAAASAEQCKAAEEKVLLGSALVFSAQSSSAPCPSPASHPLRPSTAYRPASTTHNQVQNWKHQPAILAPLVLNQPDCRSPPGEWTPQGQRL